MKKHYQTLGVAEDATQEEIKGAYRDKAKELHPDKNGGDDRGFAEAGRAYEVLSDPERRKRYDETGDDRERNLQQEVTSVILNYAITWIDEVDNEKANSMVEFIKTNIELQRMTCLKNLETAKMDIQKSRNALEIVKRKDGKANMIALALEDRVMKLESKILEIGRLKELFDLAKEEAANYSYLVDAVEPLFGMTTGTRSSPVSSFLDDLAEEALRQQKFRFGFR